MGRDGPHVSCAKHQPASRDAYRDDDGELGNQEDVQPRAPRIKARRGGGLLTGGQLQTGNTLTASVTDATTASDFPQQ